VERPRRGLRHALMTISDPGAVRVSPPL
jgi:hypothetical protein